MAALLFVVLIALNAAFVLMEYSLVRVRASRIEMLARRGSSRAWRVQDMLGNLDRYLAVVQVGITIVGLALGALCEPSISAWIETQVAWAPRWFGFAAALAALAMAQIVLGELVPRAVALQKAEAIALWSAYPLKLLSLVLSWPVSFMSWSSSLIVSLMGLKPSFDAETISEDELRIMAGETHDRGAFPLERVFLLENLFDLGHTRASEVMVPRDRIAFLSLKKTWAENLETIRARRFSRYPLCEDGLDSPIGFVHVKDVVLRPQDDLKKLRRDLTEVGEAEPLEKLLKSFPDRGTQIALVRNTLGEITGLLCLEDIQEELIGEIHDEYDLPTAWSLADWVVPGAVASQLMAPDRRTAIALLLGKLRASHAHINEEETLRLIWERESRFSSAVGRGVAVPHARLPNLEKPLIAVGRFAKPVPFASPDNSPVRLLFLILTPAGTPVAQLRILGRIAALMSNETFRRKLMRAKTPESMLELLRTADTLLA
jgi:CBS domain containing-hemolysin-like protein